MKVSRTIRANVHEKVDDLVDVVRLLEHDEVLLAATRSYHSFLVYFFGYSCFFNIRLTISEDLLPLSVQESPNLFAFRVLPLNFETLLVTRARDSCHGKQRVEPVFFLMTH